MSQDRPLVGKTIKSRLATLESWVGGGGLRNYHGQVNGLSQVDGDPDMAPPVSVH